MKVLNTKKNQQIFPSLSFYDRAIRYPYFAPDYSFSFYKGNFVKGICHNLDNRIPILSIGSNRSPYQLKRKFSLNQDICVTPARLFNSDIVYAASISAYGSMPATQWPVEGTVVDLNVLWLKEDQLNIMHLTEALGRAYNFVKLEKNSVKIRDFEYSKEIYGYVAISGAYSFKDSKPMRLLSLNGCSTKLNSISEIDALTTLKKQLRIRDKSLSQWIDKIIRDKFYRIEVQRQLKFKAVHPSKSNWEVIDVNVIGKLII